MTFGQTEALINKLGGTKTVEEILSGEIEFFIMTSTTKLAVNYDNSIENLVKDGKYDHINCDITDKNFSSSEKGERVVEFKMFHFMKHMLSDHVIFEMKNAGFRPAIVKELLSYGKKNTEEQRKHPIVALGSVTKIGDDLYVSCLRGNDCKRNSQRNASLRYFNLYGWDDYFRFLAVRN